MQAFRLTAVASLLLALALPFSAPAAAQAKEFTVGVETTEYYPIYAVRDQQWTGFSREVLDAFAAKKGYKFNYQPLPVLRLFTEFVGKDTLDFKFPDNPLWRQDIKKDAKISYSKPVFESVEGGMVLPGNVGKGLGAVQVLGTIRGFTPWPYVDAIDSKKVVLESSDDLKSLVQKAMVGRVQAIFINTHIADYHMTHELKKPGALVLDKDLPGNDVQYLLSTRKHAAVIAELDAFLASEKALIDSLKAKYKLQ